MASSFPALTQRLVRIEDPARVTVRGEEQDPARTGLDPAAIEQVWDDVVEVYRSGLYPALSLCLRHKGRVVLDRSIGHLRGVGPDDPGPPEPLRPDSLFNQFSASKLLTAMLVHLLIERGELRLDTPVARYLPGFEQNGKGRITLKEVMQHKAGLHRFPEELGMPPLELLCQPDAQRELVNRVAPAGRAGWVAYSPVLMGVILSEVIRATQGCDVRELAATEILGPLGFADHQYGVAPDETGRVADHAMTGPVIPGVMSTVFANTVGFDVGEAIGMSNTEVFKTAVIPSANVMASGRETTRFLQLLLNEGQLDGVRVFKERTLRRAVQDRTRAQPDGTFGFPMRYGLGPMLGGDRFSLFGLGTRGSFGHLGFTTVVVYADPRRKLAVSFLNTGKPFLAPGMVGWYRVLQRIALAIPRSA